MNVSRAGDRGLLVDFGTIDAASLHGAAARALTIPGVRKCVPGHSSLLVLFEREPFVETLTHALRSASPVQVTAARHDLEVSFHESVAPDLAEFLARCGLSRDTFLQRVASLTLVARYIGFRAGFAYLDGWPDAWAMPRRATSRPVARGSFAIAGAVAGFYPIDSPGGWNVLGRTDADLENAIEPGDEIRLVPGGAPPVSRGEPTRDTRVAPLRGLQVLRGPLTISTDRPFDADLASGANRAVGNDAHASLLECAMSGPRVQATEDGFVAWADLQSIEVRRVSAGEVVDFGRVRAGLRAYVAFGKSEIGASLPRGDRLRIAAIPGPHDSPLRTIECEVTRQLDRVGIRLRPLQPLGLTAPADLPSCGMQCGTLQLHPDGSLIAMGPDHPVTGGYLQPMTVVSSDVWKLAQLVPGDRVTFYSP